MDYDTRLDQIRSQITKKPLAIRRDLLKMHDHCLKIRQKMSRESVECRRLHRTTGSYTRLEQELEESLDSLEKYIVWAGLIGD
jgi:hypothetical protein